MAISCAACGHNWIESRAIEIVDISPRKLPAVIEHGFEPDSEVTPERMAEAGLVDLPNTGERHFGAPIGIKVLGRGGLDRALVVRAHAFSAGAREKIEAAGGKAEVI